MEEYTTWMLLIDRWPLLLGVGVAILTLFIISQVVVRKQKRAEKEKASKKNA